MSVTRSMSLDRSAAGLARPKLARKLPVPSDASIPGAPQTPAHDQTGSAPSLPPSTVALSDGTRISFRAVDELPELVE